jgi:hypothetical protein
MRYLTVFKAVLVASLISLVPEFATSQTSQWIKEEDEFINLINGKKLKRFLIELSVETDGTITGTGAGTSVTGSWSWQDNYFCRNLSWGNRDLGSDCQKVELRGQKLFFTSDQGSGSTAGFTIR